MVMRSPTLNVMANAALKAARGLIRDFGEVEQLQVSIKGPGEFVSTADLKADRTLRTELARARPGYALLFEESGETPGSDPRHRWIVDPLDGTTNFLHGIPHFAISIALERDGEIVAGLVYEPTRDEMYSAEKGLGAYVNDRRLRVSARRRLGEAVHQYDGCKYIMQLSHSGLGAKLEVIASGAGIGAVSDIADMAISKSLDNPDRTVNQGGGKLCYSGQIYLVSFATGAITTTVYPSIIVLSDGRIITAFPGGGCA